MRDIKQAFWIAGQNFYGWKKSPRIWMTFILAAILCLMLSDQIISHAIKYETILQVSSRLFGHMGMHPLLCCPPCF